MINKLKAWWAKPSYEESPARKKNQVKDFFDSLVIAFVIAMVIRTLLISAYKIPSESMLNTLLIGDHILASKISYILSDPKFGDIAVFEYPMEPEKDFIKRVIGEPGDKISIEGKVVYRNGEELKEPYARFMYGTGEVAIEEFVIPQGFYLMLGDNRDNSLDGRFWGFVPRKAFKGKSVIIYFSKEPGRGIRWGRLLNLTK